MLLIQQRPQAEVRLTDQLTIARPVKILNEVV
jgi:hypothetical protein